MDAVPNAPNEPNPLDAGAVEVVAPKPPPPPPPPNVELRAVPKPNDGCAGFWAAAPKPPNCGAAAGAAAVFVAPPKSDVGAAVEAGAPKAAGGGGGIVVLKHYKTRFLIVIVNRERLTCSECRSGGNWSTEGGRRLRVGLTKGEVR